MTESWTADQEARRLAAIADMKRSLTGSHFYTAPYSMSGYPMSDKVELPFPLDSAKLPPYLYTGDGRAVSTVEWEDILKRRIDRERSASNLPPRKAFPMILDDLRKFFRENKTVFYWLVVLLALDHFALGGAMRERIRSMAAGVFDRAERAIKGEVS